MLPLLRTEEEFDSVVVAIGRTADTKNLGLESVDIEVEPSNAKIHLLGGR